MTLAGVKRKATPRSFVRSSSVRSFCQSVCLKKNHVVCLSPLLDSLSEWPARSLARPVPIYDNVTRLLERVNLGTIAHRAARVHVSSPLLHFGSVTARPSPHVCLCLFYYDDGTERGREREQQVWLYCGCNCAARARLPTALRSVPPRATNISLRFTHSPFPTVARSL